MPPYSPTRALAAVTATAREGGRLVLVATPIGNLADLSTRAVAALRAADLLACEDTRRARALLTHEGIAAPRLLAVHAHNEARRAPEVMEAVRAGRTVVYVTDAGVPAVSDPGARLVRACLDAGLPVEVVPGPSALLGALVLSGMPADRFVFEGFLPATGRARRERLAAIASEPRTVVLYEAPHRIARTLAELADACGESRPVAVARELTKLHEEVWRGSLGDAARRARAGPARGEHTIVLGPARPADSTPSDDTIADALRDALGRGLSARDAAAQVASTLGVAKRRAYDAAVALNRC